MQREGVCYLCSTVNSVGCSSNTLLQEYGWFFSQRTLLEKYAREKGFENTSFLADDGYCLFPDDENRNISVHHMDLAPGSRRQSEPHLRGTTEFVTLFAGAIEITADQKTIVVQAGEIVRFQGDTSHAYRSISDQTTILHMIPYNPQKGASRCIAAARAFFFPSSISTLCLRIAPVAALIS